MKKIAILNCIHYETSQTLKKGMILMKKTIAKTAAMVMAVMLAGAACMPAAVTAFAYTSATTSDNSQVEFPRKYRNLNTPQAKAMEQSPLISPGQRPMALPNTVKSEFLSQAELSQAIPTAKTAAHTAAVPSLQSLPKNSFWKKQRVT